MFDTSTSKLTVRDAIAMRGVQEWVVDVWPNEGLDRAIRWAQCLDLLAIGNAATEGDLIVTTAEIEMEAQQGRVLDVVESLGQGGVVALGLCVESSSMCESVREIGRHHRMPVVALSARSPSLALVELMNREIAEHEVSQLRALDEVTRLLHETLADGFGLRGLIESAARLVQGPVVLLTPLGRIVAIAGFSTHQDLIELVEGDESMSADVEVDGKLWGTIVIGNVSPGAATLRWALLRRLPGVVAIEVLRFSESVPAEERARRELVIDLLVGNIRTVSELVLRASFSDFHPQPGNDLVGLAMPLAPGIRAPVTRVLRLLDIQSLEAELDSDFLILVSLPKSMQAAEVVRLIVEGLPQQLIVSESLPKPLVAVGPLVEELGEAGRSLHEARNTLTLASDMGTQQLVVTARQFAVERLFSRLLDGPDLTRFSDELLRPLIQYDSVTNGQLVHTLEAYFRNGMSKTGTARDLHLRRQSLYGRLNRIVELIGPLEDAEFCLALQIALRAHQLINTRARPRLPESWWLVHPRVR